MDIQNQSLDWDKLKNDYKYGEIESVNGFLESVDIKINGNVSRITTGWRAERDEYRKLLEQQTQDKMIELNSDNEIELRKRQAKVARHLQTRGLRAMESHKAEEVTESQAVRLVEVGLKEEREAVGINNHPTVINNTVNSMAVLMQLPVMKTHWGKALLLMTEEERLAVLGRLYELKKARVAVDNSA